MMPCHRFLQSEHAVEMTWGIVAHEHHPLHSANVKCDDLAAYPWVDCGGPSRVKPGGTHLSLDGILDQLYERTGKRVKTIVRSGSVGLFLLGTGPYLSWLSLTFLERLPDSSSNPCHWSSATTVIER